MHLTYSKVKNEFIPIESYSSLTGLVSGYVWEFKSITTENIEPNSFKYQVNGVLKWNFFGINIYTQSKSFEDIIDYKSI